MRKWSRYLKKIHILSLAVLLLPPTAAALETGDAYVGVFGGYQDGVFEEENPTTYFGLNTSFYQPTVNWGDYHFSFLGFYRDGRFDEFELGRLGAGVRDLWISPGYEGDAFLGDGLVQFITPHHLFEHLSLPGQSLRGIGTEVRSERGRAGVQAGRLTESSFLLPEALDTIDEDLAGAYLEWEGPKQSRFAGAIDWVDEKGQDRLLATLYGDLPMGIGDLRFAGWHDSLSDSIAAIGGIRRTKEQRYSEFGLLHIPEDFNYISTSASLPRGETLLFGTHRFHGFRRGYFIEGSGGWIERPQDRFLLGRGSLDGYYRILLRHIIGGGLRFLYQDGELGRKETGFQENLRYTYSGAKWHTSIEFRAFQVFQEPAVGQSRSREKTLRWLGDFRSNYRSDSWDVEGRFTLAHRDVNRETDETSILTGLNGRIVVGYGLIGGGFLEYSATWREDDRLETYGGGLEVSSPLPWGLQLTLRLRGGRSSSSNDTKSGLAFDSDSDHTTVDLFAIIEHRTYWGKPTPVFGTYTGPKPRGVGLIRGRVFADLNGNGTFDPGDKPLVGALLRLDEGFLVETDAQGLYDFPTVASGRHHLNLDPESFPIDYKNPWPEGVEIRLYPRDEKHIDWPLASLIFTN